MNHTRASWTAWLWFGLWAAACGGAAKSAEPTLRALPQANPRAVQKYLKANELAASGQPQSIDRAEALLREALLIDSYLWEAHYNLGVLYRRDGQLRKALREFQDAHETQPGATEPLLALAEVHAALGEPQQASELLASYLELDAEAPATRLAWTALLRMQGSFDDALRQARAVLVRDPKNTGALLEVGRIYRQRGEYDAAELVFNRALALDEKSPAPHNELGLTHLARGDTQLAFSHFEHAIEADKTFAPARMNRAVVLLRAGDYIAATREYQSVLEQDPTLDDARVGLGVALRAQGKHAEAQEQYEQVLKRKPNQPAALFDLGVLFAEFTDHRAQARPLFERFVDVSAEGPVRSLAEGYLESIPSPQVQAPPPQQLPKPKTGAKK
jgi:tetratricopeptide (TPR) repeat protein